MSEVLLITYAAIFYIYWRSLKLLLLNFSSEQNIGNVDAQKDRPARNRSSGCFFKEGKIGNAKQRCYKQWEN